MQDQLENSILVAPYTSVDVLGLAHSPADAQVHDETWQRAYMEKLGDLVLDMLEKSDDDVRSFLRSDNLPAEFKPGLLPDDSELQSLKGIKLNEFLERFSADQSQFQISDANCRLVRLN